MGRRDGGASELDDTGRTKEEMRRGPMELQPGLEEGGLGRESSRVSEDCVNQTSMTSIFNSGVQNPALDCGQKERKTLLK